MIILSLEEQNVLGKLELSRIADHDGVDPDPTLQKKPDPDPTIEVKNGSRFESLQTTRIRPNKIRLFSLNEKPK